ncbi:MAG: YaiO family outer membrane beta-barrel protein [Acidobacteriota bacterium]
MKRFLLLVVLIAAVGPAFCAEPPGVDELFEKARKLGFAGQRQEARAICDRILERSPDYHDVRVFQGRLYAWDKRYDEARRRYLYVLDKRPDHLDARLALIDVELWSNHSDDALRYANEGLEQHTDEPRLLYRQARALRDLGLDHEALAAARKASRIDPGMEEASKLVEQLSHPEPRNKIGLDLSYSSLSDDPGGDPAPWRRATLEYTRRFDFGSVIWRVAEADQFHREGTLYEVDAYPRLGKGRYAYLNAGHGTDDFLPDWRYGAEYFQNLPKKLTFSVGFRRLEFESTSITLYTGSFGLYRGDYFVWVRPFVSNKDIGTSVSGTLSVRRYLGDADSYATLSLGGGSAPETDPAGASTQETDLVRLDTRRASLELQKKFRKKWILSGEVRYRFEEFPNFDRNRWTFRTGIERLF